MCQISDHIKFCTCNTVSMLDGNWWMLFRRKEGYIKVGQMFFYQTDLKIVESELHKLLNNLNTTNLFDFNYIPQENDKLRINLKHIEKESEFDFLFIQGQWKPYSDSGIIEFFDDFEYDRPYYIEEYRGKIKDPFH